MDPLADGVLICHSEGYRRGVASNHADVMHWWPKHGKDMDTFRAEVAAAVKGEAGMTVEEAKNVLKAKAGLSDTTITYLYNYRWGDDLLLKLAAAMEGKG